MFSCSGVSHVAVLGCNNKHLLPAQSICKSVNKYFGFDKFLFVLNLPDPSLRAIDLSIIPSRSPLQYFVQPFMKLKIRNTNPKYKDKIQDFYKK